MYTPGARRRRASAVEFPKGRARTRTFGGGTKKKRSKYHIATPFVFARVPPAIFQYSAHLYYITVRARLHHSLRVRGCAPTIVILYKLAIVYNIHWPDKIIYFRSRFG